MGLPAVVLAPLVLRECTIPGRLAFRAGGATTAATMGRACVTAGMTLLFDTASYAAASVAGLQAVIASVFIRFFLVARKRIKRIDLRV